VTLELRIADCFDFGFWPALASGSWILRLGERDGLDYIHQRGTLEGLQRLFTNIVKQVWARDFGMIEWENSIIRRTERSDINKSSVFNLQFRLLRVGYEA